MKKQKLIATLFLIVFSLIFNSVAWGAGYIYLQTQDVVIDFKTGQPYPVEYYVFVKNEHATKTVRFDILSQAPWLVAFREGNRNQTSVTLAPNNGFNIVLEIHPENLAQGIHYGKANVKAVDPTDGNVLDSRDINITVKKDYVEPTPTPTATVTPSPTVSGSPAPSPSTTPTPASLGFTSLAALNLKEGDTISAAGSADPDIYIVNDWGYKRLFLNPVIFNFYGHLGGFASVKNISLSTRDMLVTSGIFRNCETNDPRVYGVETTGEDMGILHWINITGEQAVAQDPEFFKKVFCINNNEFSWYQKGSDYTSVSQVPSYSR